MKHDFESPQFEKYNASQADLTVAKKRGTSGFSEIVLSPMLQPREALVERLTTTGLSVTIQEQKTRQTLKLTFVVEGGLPLYRVIVKNEVNIPIAKLDCEMTAENPTQARMGKYYLEQSLGETTVQKKYGGLGIMQLAFSLLIETIKADPNSIVKTIRADIHHHNFASIYSTLRAPNLIEGGYFDQQIHRQQGLSAEYLVLITDIYSHFDQLPFYAQPLLSRLKRILTGK